MAGDSGSFVLPITHGCIPQSWSPSPRASSCVLSPPARERGSSGGLVIHTSVAAVFFFLLDLLCAGHLLCSTVSSPSGHCEMVPLPYVL